MPANEIKKTTKSTTKKSTNKNINKKLIDANKVEVSADKKPKTSIAKKLINKNKVKVNPSTTAEKQKLSKAELFKQAEEAVVRKYLTKTQKVTIATLTGVAVATSVVVPLVCNVIKNNNTTIVEPNPFNIAIYTNYTDSESGQEVFNIKPGTKVSELKPIVKEGYIFKGYFMDEECKIAYDPNHILKENDKIYALLEAEPIVEFTTSVYFMSNELASLNIDTSMTIEEVEQDIWELLAGTDGYESVEEYKELVVQEMKYNGLNYIGLCRDELGTQYPVGYKMKTTDTEIHLGFVEATYRISVPTGEGYVITDTAGKPITTFGTIPHGETIQFKVRLKEGCFGNPVVKVGDTTLTANNEIYSFEVTSEEEILVSNTYLIAGQYTLNLGSNMEVMYFAESQNLQESLLANGYSEENTIGFYSDAEFNNYIDISNTIATEDIIIYTRMATLDKLIITNGVVKAQSNGITGEVVIPASVTSIGNNAFYYCTSLTSITIPARVTSIGSYAFYYCSSLTSIIIPDRVTSIGSNAFYYCTRLISITIPDSVTSIGVRAFSGCSSLTSITIPDSVTSIGDNTFSNCSSLASITIPASVTSIGQYAFYYCSSLTSVTFAEGSKLTSIGNNAFYYCTRLISITIPASVTSINSWTFSDCSSLTSITIPASVTSIGPNAFSNCSGLTSITIPDSVTSIGSNAFSGCSSLLYHVSNGLKYLVNESNPYHVLIDVETTDITTVTIKDGCMVLAYGVFSDCSSITSVTIPASVKSIDAWAFSNCSSLTSVTFEEGSQLTSIGSSAFNGCSKLTNITIPAGVTSIENSTFSGCSSLTSITIPDSVTSIRSSAFNGCSSLQYHVSNGLKYLGNENNPYHVLIDVETTDITTATIEDGCKVILSSIFENCSSLISVTIPASVLNIEDSTFSGCSNLIRVTFAEGIKLTSIGNKAFYNCTSLTSIIIPASVTSIGDSAFEGCSNLISVTFEERSQLTSIGVRAFYGCSSLTSITIPDRVTSIGNSTFSGCSSLTSITIPDSVTSIGSSAFNGCSSLTSIIIPDRVTRIGNSTFSGCTSLISITIPDSVTSIGQRTFSGCSSLTSITIPDSVTSIGEFAFQDCDNLETVYMNPSYWQGVYVYYGNFGHTSTYYDYIYEIYDSYKIAKKLVEYAQYSWTKQ